MIVLCPTALENGVIHGAKLKDRQRIWAFDGMDEKFGCANWSMREGHRRRCMSYGVEAALCGPLCRNQAWVRIDFRHTDGALPVAQLMICCRGGG